MENSQTEQGDKYVDRRLSAVDRKKIHPTERGQERTENRGRTAMFSFWLSWQELKGRKAVFFINVILIALFLALPVSLDLLGKAKKNIVQTRIDYIGPSLILVPEGIISSDLVTAQLQGKTYSTSIFENVRRDVSRHVQSVEARLTERLSVDGRDMAVTGIDFQNAYSYPFREYSIGHNEVLLGTVAAEKLQKGTGDALMIREKALTIAGIIPTAGGIEDVSVFLPLTVLQTITGLKDRINEIRLFPRSETSYEHLKSLLAKYETELSMIDAYRGDTAEKNIGLTLLTYRIALYSVAFVLIAFCIMISTYINLDGRKSEVSTVYTVGASRGVIFQVLTMRTIWITLLGSSIGHFVALLIVILQGHNVPLDSIWSAISFIEITLGTICLGVLVTVPFALYSVYKRNPVAYL